MEQQYTNEVLETIRKNVTGDYEVSQTMSRKNNNTEITGIIIRDKKNMQKVEPVFYIDEYYEHGYDPAEIGMLILEKYKEMKEVGVPAFDVRDITDFDIIKDRIKCKVINMEMNDLYLEDKPYIQISDDLAICFYVDINRDSTATVPVTFSLAKIWDIQDENELFNIAYEHHKPAQLIPMAQAIVQSMSEMDLEIMKFESGNGDLTDDEFKEYLIESQSNMIPMYVWREGETLGASAMVYSDNIQAALEQIGGEFYILPSSIHEVIVLPYSDEYTVEDLKQMIQQVNLSQLRPEEVLSDHPYIVTREGEIFAATEREDLVQESFGEER